MTAGAQALRGVAAAEAELGSAPAVRYWLNGVEHLTGCRLVVGADGRDSTVRRRAGIPLHAIEPRLLIAGLLIEKALHTPYVSFAENLFNDAAVALPTPMEEAIPCETGCAPG